MSNTIIYYVFSALAVLIVLTVHEFSHGYVAYKLGDNTAKSMGRLTLNPIKHLDPIGALCLVIFHFGWAKPVPVNIRNFKKPKRDFAIVAVAGPISNLIIAFLSAFLYLLLYALLKDIKFTSNFLYQLASNTLLFVNLFHIINIGIGIFNLIPVPPLDGSRVLNALLPPKAYYAVLKHEKKIYLILLFWLLFGSYISAFLLSFSFVSSNPILSFIAKFFSLSGMLSDAISFVSRAMMAFWELIPFLKV